jgi:hypothetical protein
VLNPIRERHKRENRSPPRRNGKAPKEHREAQGSAKTGKGRIGKAELSTGKGRESTGKRQGWQAREARMEREGW